MANKLAELKNALGSGARANKYRINFTIPAAVPTTSTLQNADTLCKSTNFPSMTIGQIEVFNQGRKLLIPGDTTYTNSWAVTFYNTEDHGLRRDMISWMKSADNFQANTHSGNPSAVMGEMSVDQLDSAGNPTATYTFHNVFVQEVGELAIGDDQVDTIQEFDVTFSFSDWVVGNGAENVPGSAKSATKNDVA
jgi:hypothetical protein